MDSLSARAACCWTILLVSLLLIGCGAKKEVDTLPLILKIGVLADESREKLSERYGPLRAYLEDERGIPCELIIPESYDALLEMFGAGTVHLAYFDGLTYLQARAAYVGVPLVMRDVDTRFTSFFVARADRAGTTIADFRDSVFAFGSTQSTSGHLMPRHFLGLQDVVPETFFGEIRYSGAPDVTLEWVRNGVVDLGAVNGLIYADMVANGQVSDDEFRIVLETPPYPNYVWVAQSSMGRVGRAQLRDAFLALSLGQDGHVTVLHSLQTCGFLPVDAGAFSNLEEIASSMGILE